MKILLTGGRAPATLELARLFHTAGHQVFMAESVPMHLSRPSCAVQEHFLVPAPKQHPHAYAEALREIICERGIDLLLPTCEEIFYVAMGRDLLTPHCTVFTEPLERLRPLHHKGLFAQRAQAYGLNVPETLVLYSSEEAAHLLNDHGGWVLKPAYSRFAAQTVMPPLDAVRVARLPIMPDHAWVAQRYVEGRQLCTYSVAQQGRMVAHAAYRAEFTAGLGATLAFRHVDHPASLEWARRFIEAEAFTGQIAFDFIETPDGDMLALECNPRATSGVHLLARNSAFAECFLNPQSPCITPDSTQSAMLLTGMLLYALPAVRSMAGLRRWLSTVISSRDVVFSLTDPLPALLQGIGISQFLAWSISYRITLLEASTYDIEWNGAKEL